MVTGDGTMRTFLLVIARDLRFALRQRADAWLAVLFFVLTAALFPFGVGPEPNLLARIAPGIIWVVALLAMLLSLERSEEHTSELQSLMRISYAVFCLKNKNK